MKIALDTVLKDFHGEPFTLDLRIEHMVEVVNAVIAAAGKEDEALGARLKKLAQEMVEAKKGDMTLRSVIHLLGTNAQQGLTAAERQTVFQVAVQCMVRDEIELKPEKVVTLQKAIEGFFLVPAMAGQAVALLEGKDPFAAEE